MENMALLDKFANPEMIHSLTFGEKMLATFYTTVLGMLITFSALIIIWIMTVLLSKFVQSIEKRGKADIIEVKETPQQIKQAEVVTEDEDEELIAVITAAVAASLNTSIHNIVVSNIVRVSDATPSWGVAGRSEQMNSRF
ncbi:MAG: OadG family protein [Clostridia bacterium]|nr:OadG family protein [Clostridia bacterium]